MATDDNDIVNQKVNNDTDLKQEQPKETNEESSKVNNDSKLDEFLNSINEKINELTKSYDKKVDELKQQLEDKTKENEKLKNVNAQILMNTSVSKGKQEIDFSQADFDDVNWDSEASQYFGDIDKKIFD